MVEAIARRSIPGAEFEQLTDGISERGFFELGEDDFVTTGGTEWLVEVYDGHRYHAVSRVSVGQNEIPLRTAVVAAEIACISYFRKSTAPIDNRFREDRF